MKQQFNHDDLFNAILYYEDNKNIAFLINVIGIKPTENDLIIAASRKNFDIVKLIVEKAEFDLEPLIKRFEKWSDKTVVNFIKSLIDIENE